MEGLSALAEKEYRIDSSTALTRAHRPQLFPPALVMIGASTGGPQALVELLTGMTSAIPYVAVCVTLHMPSELVPVIAAHITRKCAVPTRVGSTRGTLEKGLIVFAPGDRHLTFAPNGHAFDILPVIGKSRDFCKPAIDTMFASGAATHGSRCLGVVLSGMGTDGLEGARAIVATGGAVLAQDKASSAVWGMPGAVVRAALAAAALPPVALAKEIVHRVRVPRRAP